MINNQALHFSNVNILWNVHLEYCLPTETNIKKFACLNGKQMQMGRSFLFDRLLSWIHSL